MVNLIIWLLLAAIVSSTLSKQVTFASDQVRKAFWPTFGVGLAAQFLFGFAIVIGAVLCLVLIGIPIVMSLAMGGLVVKVFGRVVLFFLIGESLSRALHRQTITPLGASLLGALVVGLISFVPFLGFLFIGRAGHHRLGGRHPDEVRHDGELVCPGCAAYSDAGCAETAGGVTVIGSRVIDYMKALQS